MMILKFPQIQGQQVSSSLKPVAEYQGWYRSLFALWVLFTHLFLRLTVGFLFHISTPIGH